MVSDSPSSDLTHFLQKALEIQLAGLEKQLTEETLKRIALKAGLTEEDWEKLCAILAGHLAKGRNFLRFANFTDAITELEHAAALAPYRADVLVDCGKAHFGRYKETGARPSRDRAEIMFRKTLEIDPDNADAAEQLSSLKKSKPATRVPGKKTLMVAAIALACSVSAWLGIAGISGKTGRVGPDTQNGLPSAAVAANPSTTLSIYPSATLPPFGAGSPLAFDRDLVAHWTFDGSLSKAASVPENHPLTKSGRVEPVEGIDGVAMRFFSDQRSGMYTNPSTKFEFSESVTVSAWVKPATRRGGQIVWFGDLRAGRDPVQLALLGNGQVRFRTDRAVTGKPIFPVRQEEIRVAPDGVPNLNQHVAADSPGMLPLNEWSFVAGRIDKVSAQESIITVFVNGEPVGETRTTEAVDYRTDGMWIALGAVHRGESQNFNGTIDEVRVYRSALTDDEIREIYHYPRRIKPD